MKSTRAFRTTVILVLAMAGFLVQSGETARRAQRGRLPLEIKVELGQDRFVMKESMVMRVLIRNTGAAPIEVPNPEDNRNAQPVYSVNGPSYPRGRTFTFRSVASGDAAPAAPVGKDSILTVAPGQTHESALPLEQLLLFGQPGRHTISAALEVGGLRAVSAPVQFTIEQAAIRSMQVLADDGFQETNPIRVLALVGAAPNLRLYQAILREERPDLGETSLAKMLFVAKVDPGATDAVAPWANHDRMDSMLNRFGWQNGAIVGIESLGGASGLHFRFPGTPRKLIRPALMSESGDVDVAALSGDASSIWMARYPIARAGVDAKLQWNFQLPAPALAARAALAPRPAEARRAVVAVARQAGGGVMFLVQAGAADPEPRLRSISIPGAVPLPESEPAVSLRPDGTVRTAAIFAEESGPRNIFVADVEWPAGTGAGVVQRGASIRLPANPRAAQVTYSVAVATPLRREWLVLLQDGSVVSSQSPGRPRKLSGKPSLPLDLLAMSHMNYLLTLDGDGLPRLELIH